MYRPTNGSRYHRHFIVVAVLCSAAFFILLGFWPPEAPIRKGERAAESLRRHHLEGRERIFQIASPLGSIPEESPAIPTELAWIVVASPLFDAWAFCTRGERLLGSLEAHLELEEVVVLPILDRARLPARTPPRKAPE